MPFKMHKIKKKVPDLKCVFLPYLKFSDQYFIQMHQDANKSYAQYIALKGIGNKCVHVKGMAAHN